MTERTCVVDGCSERYYCRGHCRLHYERLRRGVPLLAPEVVRPIGRDEVTGQVRYGTTKLCATCKVQVPVAEFRVDRRHGYLSSSCRPCMKETSRLRRVTHPDEWREIRLRRRFGITFDEYKALESEQGGVCAACGCPETAVYRGRRDTATVKQLAVDHDHTTGEIRGLLCQNCNVALGMLDEDESRIEALLAYIRRVQL